MSQAHSPLLGSPQSWFPFPTSNFPASCTSTPQFSMNPQPFSINPTPSHLRTSKELTALPLATMDFTAKPLALIVLLVLDERPSLKIIDIALFNIF
jgi:hypothetical protein